MKRLINGYGSTLFLTKVCRAYKISANGMQPTLLQGDHILVRKLVKYNPKRGDVIVYVSPSGSPFVQRVVALEDEIIEIKNSLIHINQERLFSSPFEKLSYFSTGKYAREGKPIKVPKGHVFVLGDNSANSNDSRYFGPIPISDIIGKAYKIYRPLKRTSSID